jgi:hypothetical protein
VRCGAVRCGAVRCGAVRCGAVRCGAVRCGAVRCGAVRCGAVWRCLGAAGGGGWQLAEQCVCSDRASDAQRSVPCTPRCCARRRSRDRCVRCTGSPSSNSSACSLEEPCVPTPKRVPLKGVRHIAAGAAHTLAVTADACYSWGHGQYGALGHGERWRGRRWRGQECGSRRQRLLAVCRGADAAAAAASSRMRVCCAAANRHV